MFFLKFLFACKRILNLAYILHDEKAVIWEIGEFCTIRDKLSSRKTWKDVEPGGVSYKSNNTPLWQWSALMIPVKWLVLQR